MSDEDPPRASPESPHTFNSEIAGLHERGELHRTFDGEFKGVPSVALSDDDQPSLIMSRSEGTFWRWVGLPLIIGALLGLGIAVWQWWPEIVAVAVGGEVEGEGYASAGSEGSEESRSAELGEERTSGDEPGESGDPTPAPAGDPTPAPAVEPTPAPAVEPTPAPAVEPMPAGKPVVAVVSTNVRGKIARGGIDTKLGAVDRALEECWNEAVIGGQRDRVELELRFTIKWSRRASGVSVKGEGAPAAVISCVRKAVPTAGWPEPRDLGNAVVTRRWTLSAE